MSQVVLGGARDVRQLDSDKDDDRIIVDPVNLLYNSFFKVILTLKIRIFDQMSLTFPKLFYNILTHINT